MSAEGYNANGLNEEMLQNLAQQLNVGGLPGNNNQMGFDIPVPEVINEDSEVTFQQLYEIMNKYAYAETEYCDYPLLGESRTTMAKDMLGNEFIVVSIHYFAPFKAGKFTPCEHTVKVGMFNGKTKIKNLPVKPVFDSEFRMAELMERGTKFLQLTQKPTYLHCLGYMFVPIQGGMKRIPLNSRVVVDAEGYQKISADRWYNRDQLDTVEDGRLAQTLPIVPIYSMELKRWGETPVDSLCQIQFDKTAMERTVLPKEYKQNIVTLTENFYKSNSVDFIVGKKKGLLFLLRGPPGTGKTLTANAVSELIEAPLYSVGSGDLGTKPSEIDKNLQHIFNLVESWKGCVLIDEADVFMSIRKDYAVDYNSCVSVFLRLVENYSGILFLTTNRDHSIDPAFDSRIHIKLHYGELKKDGREQVWKEALNRYGADGIDTDKLSDYELNNREITNVVQLANIETSNKPNHITTAMLEKYVKMREAFKNTDFSDEKLEI